MKQRDNPLKDFRPKGALAGEEILEEMRGVNEIVKQKATPEEAQALREWLLEAAKRRPTPRRRAASWASRRSG